MTLHSEFRKGQKVILMFRDGTKIIAKFLDHKSGRIVTTEGEFLKKELRSVNIFRQNSS